MKKEQSEKLFQKAKTYFPGGVNSPVRAFGSVGGSPLFIERGEVGFFDGGDDDIGIVAGPEAADLVGAVAGVLRE